MGPFLFGSGRPKTKSKAFTTGGTEEHRVKPALSENPPDKMREEGEQGQHEDAANPDQEVQGHLGIVNLFLIHAVTLACAVAGTIGWVR
jgi:hypothetical protein